MFLDVAPHQRREPLAHIRPAFPIIADFRRRDRLFHERQIKDAGLRRKRYWFLFFDHFKWRDALAEWKSWPIHNNEMRQLKQSPMIFPALNFLIHVRSDDEQKLRSRLRFLHRFELFDLIPLFESVYFYCRRSKSLNGNGSQRHHRKAVKRRSYSTRRFVRRSKRGDEVKFINLESFGDRVSCGEMSVMDRIESPTQYRNPHVPGSF